MTDRFPGAFGELAVWASANGLAIAEARQRFAQSVILSGLASISTLRDVLVFKGGNALDFVWLPNRSTIDLDFSLDTASMSFELSLDAFAANIEQALRVSSARSGALLELHGVRQNPPGPDRTFATLEGRVGYALPDEAALRLRMLHGQRSTRVIPIEISLNEPICASTTIALGDAMESIRIATLEDITAEKLRALLQQPIRNRDRKQDVLDLAVILREQRGEIDNVAVSRFLIEKGRARNVPISRAAFRNPEIAARARVDYDALRVTTRKHFPAFDDAMALILSFVDRLHIPDS